MWMRVYLYYCEVKVEAAVGPAVKHPSNYTLDSGMAEPCKWVDPLTYGSDVDYPSEALFMCPYGRVIPHITVPQPSLNRSRYRSTKFKAVLEAN